MNKKIVISASIAAAIAVICITVILNFAEENEADKFIGTWQKNAETIYNIKKDGSGYKLTVVYDRRVESETKGSYDSGKNVMIFKDPDDKQIVELKFDEKTGELLKRIKWDPDKEEYSKAVRMVRVNSSEW